MREIDRNTLEENLNSLGFTLIANDNGSNKYTPEECLIASCKEIARSFRRNRRLYTLWVLWLSEYARFLRVDILNKKLDSLSSLEKAFLGAFAFYAYDSVQSKSWKDLVIAIKKDLKDFNHHYIKEGFDEDDYEDALLEFGVFQKRLGEQPQRKLRPLEYIIGHNPWIKNRVLMTVSPRADIFTAYTMGLKANEIVKMGVGSKTQVYENIKYCEYYNLALQH